MKEKDLQVLYIVFLIILSVVLLFGLIKISNKKDKTSSSVELNILKDNIESVVKYSFPNYQITYSFCQEKYCVITLRNSNKSFRILIEEKS